MPSSLLPAIETGLMLPLVWRPPEYQRVFLPDTAPGQIKPGIFERPSEVQPLSICMEQINRTVIGKIFMHFPKSGKQEFIKLRVSHVVIQNLSGGFFHIHVVRRVGKNEICLHPIHQDCIALRKRSIAAEHAMPSECPQVSRFGKNRLFQFGFHIEVVLFDLPAVHLIEQRFNLRRVKACLADIKVTVFNILQQLCQQIVIPRAGYFVERDVQRLFPHLVYVHHRAGHFGIAEIDGNCQPLVSADYRHIRIDHKRVGKPKFFDGLPDFFVLFIPQL